MTTKKKPDPLVQLATRIPKSLHRTVKLHCVREGISLMDFIAGALQRHLGTPAKTRR